MKNIIPAHWLFNHIDDQNTVLIDCRFNIYDSEYGQKAFQFGHIKNAIFVDLDKNFTKTPEKHGGARPFPNLDELSATLSKIGIQKDTTVIIYDDQMNASARIWWTLKYIGHEECYLLDGGAKGWIEQGYPLTTKIYSPKIEKEMPIQLKKEMICNMEYIQQKKDLPEIILIDSREYDRFSGKTENLYKKAGHIPGAVNLDYRKNLKNGFLREKNELFKLWSWLIPFQEIILYCGSGIAASVNFLVLDELGYLPKLYIGGFSDWISYKNNLVEKGENKIF